MTWGCKPENHPDGCGWSQRLIYRRLGLVEWWCDTCERAGDCLTAPEDNGAIPVETGDRR